MKSIAGSTSRAQNRFGALSTFSQSQLRLAAKFISIVIAVGATVWFSALAEKKRQNVSDGKQRAAWASRTVAPQTQSIDSFISTWGASKAAIGDAETVRWRASDARELSASLLAFDAVNQNGRSVVRIDVKRQDGRFSVSAELAK